jgi:hypothetical protein
MGVFMRVATFVLGLSLAVAGGLSEAAEGVQTHRAAAVLADGVIAAPAVSPLLANPRLASEGSVSPSAMLYGRDGRDAGTRNGLGAMGFTPSQNPAGFLRNYPMFEAPPKGFDPTRIPLPATRTVEDHWLTGFIAVMLIAYQLRRKHRFLRPHQFST